MKGSLPGHGIVENTCRGELAGAAVHALTTERILTGMFLGKQGENYMIKDNQKSLNRFHVVLDAFVTAFSYLLAWFIVIGSGWANLLGKRTLEVGFYFGALLVIIPAYLLLYSFFGLLSLIHISEPTRP